MGTARIRGGGAAVCAAFAASLFALAGCGAPGGGQAKAPDKAASTAEKRGPAWTFAHIADFNGELTDVAVLAEDDIWATGAENDGTYAPLLLHYDGEKWSREPLPDALGDDDGYPPALEEVGDKALWMRSVPRQGAAGGGDVAWARWDGTRWSPVPNPPPGAAADLDAASPDDIWALTGERTAAHWDGTRWTTTRLPYVTVDLAVAGPDDVWAVGSRSTGPGTELNGGERYAQPASAHWDGTSWKPVDTPQARFEEPIPPEPGAGLTKVVALEGGEVRAYGMNSFNHGEVEPEPQDEYIRLRRDGTKWVDQDPAPGQCEQRIPVGQDEGGLFLDGNWYLTDDNRCLKIQPPRLPLSTGARKGSHQTLWLKEIHRVPGTDDWIGAGKVEVSQSGDPFGAPVVVRLEWSPR
ncbi:hypothetical protein ABZY90_10365 [Streptomyces sp. NPDC006422]|uniref:hypothetical protein n=1 Tax=unclassified Streptomyces TaxID=2593676 RepID=UPI0033A18BC3